MAGIPDFLGLPADSDLYLNENPWCHNKSFSDVWRGDSTSTNII